MRNNLCNTPRVAYHKWMPGEPSVDIKIITNSKSVNFEIKATGAHTPEEAAELVKKAYDLVKPLFEQPPAVNVTKE